jgi:CHRD domain
MLRIRAMLLVFFFTFVAAAKADAVNVVATTLNVPQETPLNGSKATASGIVAANNARTQLTVSETFSGLTGGSVNPIIFDFIPLGFPTGVSLGTFSGILTAANLIPPASNGMNTFSYAINALFSGNIYLNIDDGIFPSGEIRQVHALSEPETISLLGLGLLVVGFICRRRFRGH